MLYIAIILYLLGCIQFYVFCIECEDNRNPNRFTPMPINEHIAMLFFSLLWPVMTALVAFGDIRRRLNKP